MTRAAPAPLADPSLLRGQAFIDGCWTDADSGATFAVASPASGAVVAHAARCGRSETRRAIEAAQRAQRDWARQPAKVRAGLLRTLHDLVLANQEDLARILTLEQGKPIAEARAEIAYSASFLEWFAEEAKRIYGDTVPAPTTDRRIVVVRQPVGVVACITPWNFPSAMLSRKLGPALAAGNTVVCKPANETPLSAFAIAALAERAGFPPGVINMLCGETEAIGDELCASTAVRKLTFTGSTPVGKLLLARCAATVKRTSMELGGNAPFIVFDDADVDAAVAGAIASKFRNAGQTCICANRLLVQERIFDDFLDRFAAAARQFRLGDGLDAGVTMGPLIHSRAADRVRGLVADAVAHGARQVTGGEYRAPGPHFVAPTVLTGVSPTMRVCSEEIFGPVAPLLKFRTEEEVIALGNGTPQGLAAYAYTRDIGRVWRVAEGLDFGIVGINVGAVSTEVAPFGGMKESGHGREGSKYGVDDYLDIKYISIGGIEHATGEKR